MYQHIYLMKISEILAKIMFSQHYNTNWGTLMHYWFIIGLNFASTDWY